MLLSELRPYSSIFHTFMAAILNTPGTVVAADSHNSCPFCYKSGFKRLGSHLPRCPERNGRNYIQYLSKKTQQDRERSNRNKIHICPRCYRKFRRLDTHLRNSATCKLESPLSTTTPAHCTPTLDDSCPTTSVDQSPQASTSILQPHHQLKPPLKLPSTDEDWMKANVYFQEHVVPAVLQSTTVDMKNATLADGVYAYFSGLYGTKARRQRKRRLRQDKIDRELKKVSELLTKARKEFRNAKRMGYTRDAVVPIAQNFFSGPPTKLAEEEICDMKEHS